MTSADEVAPAARITEGHDMNQASTPTKTTTCGTEAHGATCLCDLSVDAPAPVRFGFNEVWYAGVVARAMDWHGQGGARLADYLEALGAAYDATRRLADFDEHWLDGGSDLHDRAAEQLRAGVSIVDLPSVLGDAFARIVGAITRGQPSITWTWTEQRWAEFESCMLEHGAASGSTLSRRFGIGRRHAESLAALYGQSAAALDTKARVRRMTEMFAEGRSSRQTLAALTDEGHTATLAGVRKYRYRWQVATTAA
jgi:hypothetical protein